MRIKLMLKRADAAGDLLHQLYQWTGRPLSRALGIENLEPLERPGWGTQFYPFASEHLAREMEKARALGRELARDPLGRGTLSARRTIAARARGPAGAYLTPSARRKEERLWQGILEPLDPAVRENRRLMRARARELGGSPESTALQAEHEQAGLPRALTVEDPYDTSRSTGRSVAGAIRRARDWLRQEAPPEEHQ